MRKLSLSIVAFVFCFIACKQSITIPVEQIENKTVLSKSKNSFYTSVPAGSTRLTPLFPQPDGSYTCTYGTVPLKVTGIISRDYDNNGNPVQVQDGDPFLGSLSIVGTYPSVITYNNESPQNDQFSIKVYTAGGTLLNYSAYRTAMNNYISSIGYQASTIGLPSYLWRSSTPVPLIINYLTYTSGSSFDVTGRMTRIYPPVLTGIIDPNTGREKTTTFALAPATYTRSGYIPPASAGCPGANGFYNSNCPYCATHPSDPKCP